MSDILANLYFDTSDSPILITREILAMELCWLMGMSQGWIQDFQVTSFLDRNLLFFLGGTPFWSDKLKRKEKKAGGGGPLSRRFVNPKMK